MTDTEKSPQPDDMVLVFKERAGKPGGGKGILIGQDRAFTVATIMEESICYLCETKCSQVSC